MSGSPIAQAEPDEDGTLLFRAKARYRCNTPDSMSGPSYWRLRKEQCGDGYHCERVADSRSQLLLGYGLSTARAYDSDLDDMSPRRSGEASKC